MTSVITKQFHSYSIFFLILDYFSTSGNLGKLVCMKNSNATCAEVGTVRNLCLETRPLSNTI